MPKSNQILGILLFLIGIAIFFFPNISEGIGLAALETGQLQSQGLLTGKIMDFAATVNQDISLKFSTGYGLGNQRDFGGFPIDCWIEDTLVAGWTYTFLSTGIPPSFGAQPIELQPVVTIPYSKLVEQGGGAHLLICKIHAPDNYEIVTGQISFDIWVDGSDCQMLGTQMEVIEAYSAGQTLTLQSFRWQHTGFCYQRPLRITDSQGIALRQSLDEYALLLNGSTLTVPMGEVWLFTYIAQQTPDIPVVCPDGSAYDPNSNQCVITPPVVFSCSGSGIFDPVQQVCVIQAESRIVCEIGVYNTELKQCVHFVPEAEATVICPLDSTITVDAEGIAKCVFEGQIEYICEAGHYNPETQTCQVQAIVEYETIELWLGRKTGLFTLGLSILFIATGIIIYRRKR